MPSHTRLCPWTTRQLVMTTLGRCWVYCRQSSRAYDILYKDFMMFVRLCFAHMHVYLFKDPGQERLR